VGVVLEAIPAELAAKVSEQLTIPTIGIGAGSATDAQVIVWQDLVGLTPDPAPKFVRRYANIRADITQAAQSWRRDVEDGSFPSADESYR
jgi:3-methyl-2-oxobutanoate hydroxymethyltransferase